MYPSSRYTAFAVLILFTGLLIGLGQSCKQASAPANTAPENHGMAYAPNYALPEEGELPSDLDAAQGYLEELTWQRFISLNWPAKTDRPEADPEAAIPASNSYQTVWNNWGLNYDLYLLPDGLEPLPLTDQKGLREQRKIRWSNACPELLSDGGEVLKRLVADEFIEAGLHPAPHYPLIDKNGKYVRTSVLYNPTLYDFVYDNKLYSTDGLQDYLWSDDLMAYESGSKSDTMTSNYRIDVPDGSIMLKASWKVMGAGDDPSRFFTKDIVFVFENGNLDGPVETFCETVKVGLVGFHMTIKTPNQQNWVWSTFEHVGNVPDLIDERPSGHYNFWDKAGLARSTGINIPPTPTDSTGAFDVNPFWYDPEKPGQVPTQAMRIVPITKRTRAINKKYQELLKNTVWKNYALVGTQWEYKPNEFTPQLISNTTLETFEQTQASCMGCHNLLTGIDNNPMQIALGNVPELYVPLFADTQTVDGKVESRTLHSDWMWSSLKVYRAGQLSWNQIRPVAE